MQLRQYEFPMRKNREKHKDCGCCFSDAMQINGRVNHCSECNVSWCHMCKCVVYNHFKEGRGPVQCSVWEVDNWCSVWHYCRFKVVDGRRVANSGIFYWPCAILVAILYPVWGLLDGLFMVTWGTFAEIAEMFNSPSCGLLKEYLCLLCCVCTCMLFYGIFLWTVLIMSFLFRKYFVYIFFAFVAPCIYSSKKTNR